MSNWQNIYHNTDHKPYNTDNKPDNTDHNTDHKPDNTDHNTDHRPDNTDHNADQNTGISPVNDRDEILAGSGWLHFSRDQDLAVIEIWPGRDLAGARNRHLLNVE